MIKFFRNKKGYSQESTARAIGVTLRHFIKIENYENAPNVYTAILLSKYLDEPIQTLFPLPQSAGEQNPGNNSGK